jgi:hypothetical protein
MTKKKNKNISLSLFDFCLKREIWINHFSFMFIYFYWYLSISPRKSPYEKKLPDEYLPKKGDMD